MSSSTTGTPNTDLANALMTMRADIDAKRAALNFKGSDAERLGIRSSELTDQIIELQTKAVADAIRDAAGAVQKITEATQQVNHAIGALTNVSQALTAAAKLIAVAVAVASGNVPGTIGAATDFLEYVAGLKK